MKDHDELRNIYRAENPVKGDNKNLFEAKAKLRLYVSELEYPVNELRLPTLDDK